MQAYDLAGFSPTNARFNASRLAAKPQVRARIEELHANREKIASKGLERAIERTAITKERVLRELSLIGFANMQDYMRAGPDGDPYLDFSNISRDQAAALVEVTVEDFKDGRGPDARDVRRVKFKLADKKGALVDIGKELGMFIERKSNVPYDELEKLTTDELLKIANGDAPIPDRQRPVKGVKPKLVSG